ncbi:cysteine-rich receptor-like protein kinase 10 [Coffea eugenioides]|nr:cysteine-rich receptor-like protein kinase 10 [Coffea eugenioides]
MNQPFNIWAANNYQTPARKQPAYLIMNADGRLGVDDSFNNLLFVVNGEQSAMINSTTAALLDNGNLVLRAPGGITVWQSFDYPSNTWLQGMRIGIFDSNMRIPRQSILTSLSTFDEPNSTLAVDHSSTKELIVMQDGVVYWRSGIWDGLKFSFLDFFARFGVTFSYFSDANESFFTWNSSTDPYALLWFSTTGNITVISGDFGANRSMAVCDEIDENKSKEQSLGCTNPCGGGDGFREILAELDVWDGYTYSDQTLAGCKLKCRTNCSCYAYSYITYNQGGWGCKTTRSRKGQLLYSGTQRSFVRDSFDLAGKELNSTPSPGLAPLASPALAPSPPSVVYPSPGLAPLASPALAPSPPSVVYPMPSAIKKSKKWKVKLSIGVLVTFLGALILLYLFCCLQCKNGDSRGLREFNSAKRLALRDKRVDDELPFFGFTIIEIATNHFADENLLGQGGFGPVYKGKLHDGQEIAVKRLKHMSGFGMEQFKNEVTVISKLQHRNLVRLLGYCIHREERILIYEYLPNKSLDSIVFDSEKGIVLDWKRRSHIIDGIAQGLLYLHKYSRLKIIHRDLKTSNVLLDNDLNPKISDFGTARIFGDNESRANTKKVVGTYGYMSPEYAMNGIFSVKSDVYSFGVMMLEIISGKKNTSFYDSDDHLNLIGYVWDLWVEGRVTEAADRSFGETFSKQEITRYVQVGLLCVQENAVDRPTMSDVLSMLNNDSVTGLPVPNRPGFSCITSRLINDNPVQNQEPCSISKVTISDVEGR